MNNIIKILLILLAGFGFYIISGDGSEGLLLSIIIGFAIFNKGTTNSIS